MCCDFSATSMCRILDCYGCEDVFWVLKLPSSAVAEVKILK